MKQDENLGAKLDVDVDRLIRDVEHAAVGVLQVLVGSKLLPDGTTGLSMRYIQNEPRLTCNIDYWKI